MARLELATEGSSRVSQAEWAADDCLPGLGSKGVSADSAAEKVVLPGPNLVLGNDGPSELASAP